MTPRAVIGVHGYRYDRADPSAGALYAAWADLAGIGIEPFTWDSNPSLLRTLWEIRFGFRPSGAYELAWVRAARAGEALAETLLNRHGRAGAVIAHSLGTRVVCAAALRVDAEHAPERVIFLGGAETAEAGAAAAAAWPQTRFVNVIGKCDWVLDELAAQVIGISTEDRRVQTAPGRWDYPRRDLLGIQGLRGLSRPPNWRDCQVSCGHWGFWQPAHATAWLQEVRAAVLISRID